MPYVYHAEHLIVTFMCVCSSMYIENAVKIALATHKNQYKPIHSQYAKTEEQHKSKFRFILDNLIANGWLFFTLFLPLLLLFFTIVFVVVAFSYKSAAKRLKNAQKCVRTCRQTIFQLSLSLSKACEELVSA